MTFVPPHSTPTVSTYLRLQMVATSVRIARLDASHCTEKLFGSNWATTGTVFKLFHKLFKNRGRIKFIMLVTLIFYKCIKVKLNLTALQHNSLSCVKNCQEKNVVYFVYSLFVIM